MTLADFDNSRNRGEPIELYLFRYGTEPTAFHALTDSEKPYVFEGVTYTPSPLKRGSVNSGQSLDKTEMKITTNFESPVAELFRVYAPSNVVTLIIRSGHRDDPDQEFDVTWVGRVQQSRRDGRVAELSGIPDSISIRRSGLRRHYQLTCPHILYDQGQFSCKASKAAGTVAAVPVVSFGYLTMTFAPGWNGAFTATKFVGGMVEWDGSAGAEKRTIMRVDGDTLSLNGPTTDIAVSDLVDVVVGCNHQLSDCEAIHANTLNFGGMPYIPEINPVSQNPF